MSQSSLKWEDCIYSSKGVFIACDKCFIISLVIAAGMESWGRTSISSCGEKGDTALGGRIARLEENPKAEI